MALPGQKQVQGATRRIVGIDECDCQRRCSIVGDGVMEITGVHSGAA